MKYRLKIENPCEEDWNKMSMTEGGRFCLHCSKTVMDFTQLSDREILHIIKNSPDGICGRLRADQQNRDFVIERETSGFRLTFSKIAASLLLIGIPEAVSAQATKQETSITGIAPIKKKAPSNPTAKKKLPVQHTHTVITGCILDNKTSYPLAEATVFIKNTSIFVKTDSEGYFTLPLPLNLLKDSTTVLCRHSSYYERDIVLKPYCFNKIYLKQKEPILLTEIKVESRLIPTKIRSFVGTITYDKEQENKKKDDIVKINYKTGKASKRKWWQFWKMKKTNI